VAGWTENDLPDQTGRTIVVTGANSGVGEATARQLAARGATVVLACRNFDKAAAAASRMTGKVTVERLDLASLDSVRSFAADSGPIDVLVNNAGIMAVPCGRTKDGFELQIGTNFLGPFALTGLLLPKITDRVVTLSSQAHRIGRVDVDDLNWTRRRYRRWGAYTQSKLADLIFAFELHRRFAAAGSSLRSLAAHPGYTATELQSHTETFQDRIMALANPVVAQKADRGALPTLYAATMPQVRGGEYYGPDGFAEMRGFPKRVESTRAARDQAVAARLWVKAEELTGVSYAF
jgi:NAD(P)-dependent dehydrogenase (short-subunit alcohol dehydrogenase family)